MAEAKNPSESMTRIVVRWGGVLLIALGAMVLFSSYIYVPLDVWSGGQPWNPMTWQYHWGSSFAGGWLGIIPLVVGIVLYIVGRMMKPKVE